jgi:hypothetical protein
MSYLHSEDMGELKHRSSYRSVAAKQSIVRVLGRDRGTFRIAIAALIFVMLLVG